MTNASPGTAMIANGGTCVCTTGQSAFELPSLSSGPRIYGAALSTGGTVADVDDWPRRIAAVTPS